MRTTKELLVREGDPITHDLWNDLVRLVMKGIRPTGQPPIRVVQTSIGAVVSLDDVVPKFFFGVLVDDLAAPSQIGSYIETTFRRYVLTTSDNITPSSADEQLRNYDPSLTGSSGSVVIVTDAIGGFWTPIWVGCAP